MIPSRITSRIMLALRGAACCLSLLVAGCGGSTSSAGGTGGGAGVGASAGAAGDAGSAAQGGTGQGGTGQGGSAGIGAPPQDCDVPSDCIVVPASCCGACGAATRGDAVAINRSEASTYRQQLCFDMDCPACDMPRDPTLVATCSAGRCELVDLLQHEATACTRDEDCVLRTNECCNCGGAQDMEHLIAVNSMSSYPRLVCDPDEACDACVDAPPDRARAYCATNGHCAAEWALD
ncbi:MAG: hypothetical protein R3B89_25455 [Polyangiaceae bacterium]